MLDSEQTLPQGGNMNLGKMALAPLFAISGMKAFGEHALTGIRNRHIRVSEYGPLGGVVNLKPDATLRKELREYIQGLSDSGREALTEALTRLLEHNYFPLEEMMSLIVVRTDVDDSFKDPIVYYEGVGDAESKGVHEDGYDGLFMAPSALMILLVLYMMIRSHPMFEQLEKLGAGAFGISFALIAANVEGWKGD